VTDFILTGGGDLMLQAKVVHRISGNGLGELVLFTQELGKVGTLPEFLILEPNQMLLKLDQEVLAGPTDGWPQETNMKSIQL